MLNKKQYDRWRNRFPKSYFQSFDDAKEGRPLVRSKSLFEVEFEEAKDLNEKGAGIFFSPNGFSKFSGRKEKDCDIINYWFVDIEGYPKPEQLKKIRESKLQPSILIETKNGYHAYWKIKGTASYWHKVIDNLIEFFGSDLAISSLNEVLRFPGFFHKKAEAFLIKPIQVNENEYSEEEMLKAFPVVDKLAIQLDKYEDDIDKIKAIPIKEVLNRLGVKYNSKNFILDENNKVSSAHIHEKKNYIHRFSGKPGSGTVIDAVMAWGNEDLKGAIDWLRQEFGIARKELKEKAETPIWHQSFCDATSLVSRTFSELENTSEEDIIEYPIQFFNKEENLRGIFPRDLVVVGAYSGGGKSQFLNAIAQKAVDKGKRVAYFDLENDNGDYICRRVAVKASKILGREVSLTELKYNKILKNEREAQVIVNCFSEVDCEISGKIFFYNNRRVPTIEKFEKDMDAIIKAKNVDLVVLDHLHYFDMEGKDVNNEISRIMRKLRIFTKELGVPVVVASHFRKTPQNQAKGYEPGNHDLFGSSSIAKEAGVVILFSETGDNDYNTLIQITKNRSNARQPKIRAQYSQKERTFVAFEDEYSGRTSHAPKISFT